MIRQKAIATNSKLPALREFLAAYPELAVETVQNGLDQNVTPHFLNELQYEAERVVYPFIWSLDPVKNAKARAWFFVHYPKGYKRTGALSRAWKVTIIANKQSLSMKVENRTKGARFVVGDLKTGEGQIPGHKASGWPLAKPTIDFWQVAAQEQAHESIRALWKGRR